MVYCLLFRVRPIDINPFRFHPHENVAIQFTFDDKNSKFDDKSDVLKTVYFRRTRTEARCRGATNRVSSSIQKRVQARDSR